MRKIKISKTYPPSVSEFSQKVSNDTREGLLSLPDDLRQGHALTFPCQLRVNAGLGTETIA